MADPTSPRPSLDLLRGFEAAARHLSFTHAAHELFITQSAVSRQIKALEERLGVILFVRGARGIGMTEAGERLYRAVSAALAQVQEAVASLSNTGSRTVTLSCTLAFCSLWLIPRLSSFQKAHPGVEVRLSASNEVVNLGRSRIDLAIRYAPAQRAPTGALRLFGEAVAPMCAPALLKDKSRPLHRIEDLRHHILLHLDEPMGPLPWLWWSTWLEAAGLPQLQPAGSMHFNHYEQVIRAALSGQGVALGRMPLLGGLVNDGSLTLLFPDSAASNRAYWVVTSEAARQRPEVGWFVEWLMQEGAEETRRDQTGVTKPNLNAKAQRTQRSQKKNDK
jgi:LysR family transcriptional regulator, glycine cleavage system transcriptional activator